MNRRLPLGGTTLALGAALLFGATTPFASALARSLSPLWLSAALYLGVAVVLVGVLGSKGRTLARVDVPWLVGSALIGGVAAPVLLVFGLRSTDAATASLLLAVEPVATALIAWFIVREHASRRTIIGMLTIACGAALLAWHGSPTSSFGSVAVLAAAVCWGVDNNLAGRITSSDTITVTGIKGLVAGSISLTLALLLRDPIPAGGAFIAGSALGLVGYGVSLVAFMGALRRLGTARTSAYFATAPFVGATIGLCFGRPADLTLLLVAGALMAAGVWLHLSEQHEHDHIHLGGEHEHAHVHDEHHIHAHRDDDINNASPHMHRHRHERLVHRHGHTPDVLHRHAH